jgi:ABC-type multidrug transport system ATPase subunit
VRKAVTIVRALMLAPELLLMDDPFTGLDSRVAKELVLKILEMRAEGTIRHVFFTSREDTWSERLGVERLVIENGQVTFEGSKTSAHDGKAA